MKKFYQKKDLPVEESPLTLQLQRRHTVVEGDKENKVVTKLKPVSRSNSTSSIYRSPKTAKDLSSQKGHLASTLSANSSGSSSASTVVITECQLSSSWIYNNKKAQMGSNEVATTSGSSSQQASDNEEAKSPILPRPKVKSISSRNNRSRRCSSCCCYGAIVILATFAMMGIISTIGGIIYMELFSGSNKTHNRGPSEIGRGEDLSYMKKIGQALDANENDTIPDLKSNEEIQNPSSKQKQDPEILDHFKDLDNDNTGEKQGKRSGNILRVKKTKKDTLPVTESDIPTSIHTSHGQQPQEDSGKKQSFHQTDFLPSSAKNNSPYSKLFELYKDIHTDISKNSSIPDESSRPEIYELNTKVTDSKADEPSDSFEDNISEISHQNGAGSDKQLRVLDESFDASESLKTDPVINSEKDISQSEEVSEPEIPKYFFRRPHADHGLDFRNLFGITEENGNSEVQPSVHGGLHHIPQLSDLNENVSSKLDLNNNDVSLNSDDSLNGSHESPNGEMLGPAIPKNQDVPLNLDDPLNESFESPSGGVSGPAIPKNQGIHLDFDDSSSESFEPPGGEMSGPAIPINFFQMPGKDTDLEFRNMFENSDDLDSEQSSSPRFLPHVPELSDQSVTGDNITNTQESDLPLELNHPISEAKIAVPGPLDLIRRFAMGESDTTKDSETDQHDRRFFLAEALERLRSLDVRNILPTSRQKADSKKKPELKFVPQVRNEQEVVTERSNYLQHLRRRFFEQFE